MSSHELMLILDFGSQYTQLIAKKIRKLNIYSEIVPYNINFEEVIKKKPKAIIFSGSPYSVNKKNAPFPDKRIFAMKVPMLGICYGMQLLTKFNGGAVIDTTKKEYGYAQIEIVDKTTIFAGMNNKEEVWMSHGDAVSKLPTNFNRIAYSPNSPYAAISNEGRNIYALQFHPEVVNTTHGFKMLENFALRISEFKGDWTAKSFIESSLEEIRQKVGNEKVILGLSGGVDSSVTAALLYKAVGDKLVPILVDTGLLRKNEVEEVEAAFNQAFGLELNIVDAKEIFFDKLKSVFDPEKKRKIIGETFIEIFDKEAKKFDDAKFLAQGTLYPDVIESVSFKGPSATIKSHHNVGGLPEKMNLRLIEPLRELFKDEVREVGYQLGLPKKLVDRHPFPGPGLAIRIISDVTEQKVKLLQDIDNIFIRELYNNDLYNATWQAFAVLLPIRSVGVMGDERTYENVCALRAVNSKDGMTADWTEFSHYFLKGVCNRLIKEVRGGNGGVYYIS